MTKYRAIPCPIAGITDMTDERAIMSELVVAVVPAAAAAVDVVPTMPVIHPTVHDKAGMAMETKGSKVQSRTQRKEAMLDTSTRRSFHEVGPSSSVGLSFVARKEDGVTRLIALFSLGFKVCIAFFSSNDDTSDRGSKADDEIPLAFLPFTKPILALFFDEIAFMLIFNVEGSKLSSELSASKSVDCISSFDASCNDPSMALNKFVVRVLILVAPEKPLALMQFRMPS